jgi:hypothetical protein
LRTIAAAHGIAAADADGQKNDAGVAPADVPLTVLGQTVRASAADASIFFGSIMTVPPSGGSVTFTPDFFTGQKIACDIALRRIGERCVR